MSPGTTATGGLSERNRQTNRQRRNPGFDPSGFNDMGADRSKPSQLIPAKVISPPYESRFDVNKVLDDMNNQIATNTGVAAFNKNQSSGSGMNVAANLAQQVLGDSYSQALSLGYKPSELVDMVTNAQDYGRGIDIDKFKTDLNRFQGFKEANGGIFKFDEPQDDGSTISQQYLSVSRPELSANAPTLAQLMGDIGGGIGDMFGAGADFIMGGGTMGNIISGLKDKFSQGKEFVKDFTNPMDIQGKLAAADSEVRRKYALYLSQGMPYQQAYQMATGQELMARGGISNLN